MKRVIITGATSMLGLAVVKECIDNGVEVLAYVRKNSKKTDLLPKSDLLHVVYADVDQFAELQPEEHDYDVFYHFAWAYTDKSGRNDVVKQTANIQTTLDAICLAKRLGCKKFVGAGSQAEYGIHVDKKTGPNSPINPQMAYGVAKYAAGKLGAMLAESMNMDFIWVRIFSVFGPGELPTTMISSTIRKLQNGEHVSFTPATHQWDYLYVDDAARAFFLIGEKATGNKVFCLGSGESRPLREYIQELADIVAPGAKLGLGELPYSENVLPGMTADVSALTEEIGGIYKTQFQEGIAKMLPIALF